MMNMGTSGEFDEVDTTEEHFDRMMAEATPISLAAAFDFHESLLAAQGTYYTLTEAQAATTTRSARSRSHWRT